MKKMDIKSAILTLLFLLTAGVSSIVAAAGYIIGAGDEVNITVYEHPDLSTNTRVSDNGKISFPLIGQVVLSGLNEREAEDKISMLLKQGKLVRSPQVSVIVNDFNSQQVSVLGYVNRPGKYPIEQGNSLVDLIAQAGGVSSEAGDLVIITNKSNNQRQKFDLTESFIGEAPQENISINTGDVIYVPKMNMFYIYGEVQKPGSYRLEKGMNVMQALSVGGSVTARGTERGIKIKRKDSDGEIKEISAKKTDVLLPNDVIYIKESLF